MECAVGEVAVRGIGFSGDPVATDLLAPEVTMAMAVDSSREVTGASQDTSLVLPLLLQPASSSVPLATDDVVQQFDATHQLSELTMAWGSFVTFVTSFGEKLQVSFVKFFLWMFVFLLFLFLFSLSLFCSVLLSRSYRLLFLV